MAVYRRVDDSRHLQADCQEPGLAPRPYARQPNAGYLFLSEWVCVRLSTIISSELNVRSSAAFARKPRLLGVAAQLKRGAHAALGMAIKCAQ